MAPNSSVLPLACPASSSSLSSCAKTPLQLLLPISFIPSIAGLLAAQRYHLVRKLTTPSTLLYHVFDTQPTPTQPSEPKLLPVSVVPVLVWFFNGTKKQNITDFWSDQFWFCTGSGKTFQGLFLHKCNPDDPVLCPLSPTDTDQFRLLLWTQVTRV